MRAPVELGHDTPTKVRATRPNTWDHILLGHAPPRSSPRCRPSRSASYDDLAPRSPTAPPTTHGLYAWWQDAGALPGISGTPHPTDPDFELLYVGTAPKDDGSKSNLRKRLGNRHRAAIGSFTFRLDLTAFLWQAQSWQAGSTDRPKLLDANLAALADWQREHLHVQWVECPQPWDAEMAVVHAMRPPLNREHNQGHTFYNAVGAARDALRASARLDPLWKIGAQRAIRRWRHPCGPGS